VEFPPNFEVLLGVYTYRDISTKYVSDMKNGGLALYELKLTLVGLRY
jgi:hypothetical protein